MDGFIFFLIFVFVIVPIIKNVIGGKSANKTRARAERPKAAPQKNWAEVQKLLQEQMKVQNKNNTFGKRDAHGHTAARQNTRQRLRGSKGSGAFPKSHQARVKERDMRDRSERNRIEAMLHSKKNRSIVRVGNKSIDGWGARGDIGGGGGWLFMLLFGLIAFFVLSKTAPDLLSEITRVINN